MKLIGKLKQSAQLFLGIHPSLVSTRLQPDHPVLVEIRLVDPLGHGAHDNHPTLAERHILRLHRQRTPHQLAGGVTDELVDAGNVSGDQPRRRTTIGHANQNRAALRIGKRRHLRRQGLCVAHIYFELALAVLAEGDLGLESSGCHLRYQFGYKTVTKSLCY